MERCLFNYIEIQILSKMDMHLDAQNLQNALWEHSDSLPYYLISICFNILES